MKKEPRSDERFVTRCAIAGDIAFDWTDQT